MENALHLSNNLLVLVGGDETLINKDQELAALSTHFCGTIVRTPEEADAAITAANHAGREIDIFVAGDLSSPHDHLFSFRNRLTCFESQPIVFSIITEKVINTDSMEELSPYISVSMGQVPINVHGVGVFYRDLFGSDGIDYFKTLDKEHKFQILTDSNKPSSAYRKGIYLSEVIDTMEGPMFHLLRCSTNLDGPTEGFTATDRHIVQTVNRCATRYFQDKTDLNHVLAQIYYNNPDTEKKAKIKEHSDKTKDMPGNGLMAFCSFYNYDSMSNTWKMKQQGYDIVYNNHTATSTTKVTTALTRMRFKLKTDVPSEDIAVNSWPRQFDVTLYPNSVFLMSLSANRYYTHAIVPSVLSAGMIPTRLGYVIRCSCTPAIYSDAEQRTFLLRPTPSGMVERYPLQPNPSPADIHKLKDLYFLENTASQRINYEAINLQFSLNSGDYLRPVTPGANNDISSPDSSRPAAVEKDQDLENTVIIEEDSCES
jgi:hypothetical protein